MDITKNLAFGESGFVTTKNSQDCEVDDDITYHYSNLTANELNACNGSSSHIIFVRSDLFEQKVDTGDSMDPLDSLAVTSDYDEIAMDMDPFHGTKELYSDNSSLSYAKTDESSIIIENSNQDLDEFCSRSADTGSFSVKECHWEKKYKSNNPVVLLERITIPRKVLNSMTSHQDETTTTNQLIKSSKKPFLRTDACEKENHIEDEQFVCECCFAEFADRNLLQIHMQIHKGERLYKCSGCSATFDHKKDLINHLESHLDSEENTTIDPLATDDAEIEFNCAICSEIFTQKNLLDDHIKSHEEKNQFTSDYDSVKLDDKSDEDKHANDKLYKCYLCLAKFAQKKDFNNHVRIHTDKTMLKCDICLRGFKRTKTLDDHLETFHEGELPFECDECPAKFNKKQSLSVHRQNHENQPISCHFCGMKFKSMDTLSQHIKLHIDFSCKICKMKFKYRKELKTHTLSHMVSKRFKCDKCPASFQYSAAFSKHQQIHEEKILFQCDICSAKFPSVENLNIHKQIHNKLYKCDVCFQKFTSSDSLNDHKQRSRHIREFQISSYGWML